MTVENLIPFQTQDMLFEHIYSEMDNTIKRLTREALDAGKDKVTVHFLRNKVRNIWNENSRSNVKGILSVLEIADFETLKKVVDNKIDVEQDVIDLWNFYSEKTEKEGLGVLVTVYLD